MPYQPSKSLFQVKAKRRFISWLRCMYDDIAALADDRTARLQLLTFPFLLAFIFSRNGWNGAADKIVETSMTVKAIIWALPAYILFSAFCSLFRVAKEERSLGSWSGSRFNYDKPVHVYTYHITPEDDGKVINLKFSNAEPNSFAWYRVEYDGGIAKAWIDVHESNAKNWWNIMNRSNQTGGIRLTKDKEAKLILNCPPESDQTTIRIYMRYWEL